MVYLEKRCKTAVELFKYLLFEFVVDILILEFDDYILIEYLKCNNIDHV